MGRTTTKKELLPALQKYGADRVWKVLRYLDENRPKINWWLSHLDKEFEEYEQTLTAKLFEYPVAGAAYSAKNMLDGNDPIPMTYIQHCIDEYRKFARWLQDRDQSSADQLLEMMPPPIEFAIHWFTHIAKPDLSLHFRKFSVCSWPFRKYSNTLMIGVARSGMVDALLRNYNASDT